MRRWLNALTLGVLLGIGLAQHVGGRAIIDRATYAVVVAMVILTALVTPPTLKWSLGRSRRGL